MPSTQNFRHNMDKPNGPDIRLKLGSGVVLTSFPYNLNVFHERILCEVEEYGGILRTTMYKLEG